MAGFGRFKLTDALPEQTPEIEAPSLRAGDRWPHPTAGGRVEAREEASRPVPRASRRWVARLAAEQVREARETNQAKNAEGSIRDRMVDIGRGNQQAGRQRAK